MSFLKKSIKSVLPYKPGVVLMGLMMPGLDGYSACQAIKSEPETNSIKVLMLTGVDSEANRKYAGEMGSDAYFTKPFTAEQLLHTVEQFE